MQQIRQTSMPVSARQHTMAHNGHSIVVAGGGPTGMMLAGELALAGIDVAIVERRTSQDIAGSRAGGLHAGTIELLDRRGIVDRFLSQGRIAQVAAFGGTALDISDFPTRHNYGLALWQNHIERILAEWIAELPVTIYRGSEVVGFTQDRDGVDVEMSEDRSLRAEYLVGCDGGRSVVRKRAGIDFPGWDPTISNLIAEAEMSEEPEYGFRYDHRGLQAIGKLDNGLVRVVLTEQQPPPANEPTLEYLSEMLASVYGTDYGVHGPRWISRFTDTTRQAASYRKGRVLLAGDSAHVHYPAGGQGLNIGVQDAVNLGWKLAQVVKGQSPECLLDTYHAERHPIAARALRLTMAQVALRRQDERSKALADTVSELLAIDEARQRIGATMSGLDIRYDLGDGHPLVGRCMPDLDLIIAGRPTRVFTLLHEARPVLLKFGEPDTIDIAPWADRVRTIDATCEDAWELPLLDPIAAPGAVLIRPDGYVAWVGGRTTTDIAGLAEALSAWFGPPAACP